MLNYDRYVEHKVTDWIRRWTTIKSSSWTVRGFELDTARTGDYLLRCCEITVLTVVIILRETCSRGVMRLSVA